jgi:myo-inositol-1(or 4)-monophosphatase
MEELFVGIRGRGASKNGRRIAVRPRQELCETLVGVSFGSNEDTMQRMERVISALIRRCHKVRVLGSCGLDIVNVACGRLGALVQRGVRCWDFAASRIILEEAGGAFDAEEFAQNRWDIVACFPHILDPLKEMTCRT